MAAVDIAENRPGKLLRAYVRVLCAPQGEHEEVGRIFVSDLWSTLSGIEGILELFDRDEEQWEQAFARDGLDPTRTRIVRYAAERAAATRFGSGGTTIADHKALRLELLAMSEPAE